MCGICCFLRQETVSCPYDEHLEKLKYRGPDWTGSYERCHEGRHTYMGHNRLAIVGVGDSGRQPIIWDEVILCVNGEIYNHQELRTAYCCEDDFITQSDCEIICHLYRKFDDPLEWLSKLNGMFAFVLYDERNDTYLVARDNVGIIPLYYDNVNGYASEAKALLTSEDRFIDKVTFFPPGHFTTDGIKFSTFHKLYAPAYDDCLQNDGNLIRERLTAAVQSHLMSEVPFGVLLSGGLDSSLIAAIVCRLVQEQGNDAWFPKVHTFSIGLAPDSKLGIDLSPDLVNARKVAKYLGTIHHEFTFTVEEAYATLPDVIHHIETYDVTTIRASTPMYLLAQRIRKMGFKMVLSGEGADEIFGGYLYFKKAPSPKEFYDETVRKMNLLHFYDCRRANHSTMAASIELRVPFLDQTFVQYAMNIDPALKMSHTDRHGGIEKYILRNAFQGYIPDEVLWRQKEQFSDGVGYGWIDHLKERAELEYSDSDLAFAQKFFTIVPPQSKEALLYREHFINIFPQDCMANLTLGGPSVACSTPAAIAWDKSFQNCDDPSGRAVDNHNDSYHLSPSE